MTLTEEYRPQGETHWSTRTMAGVAGVSKSTVQRVWKELGLKPHRVDTFKVSGDPKFDEKLVDVVGLYLNPPENAIVLCADEKSSVQALDRTQASLPMTKGRGQTMTHDYKRNGPTTSRGGGAHGHQPPRHKLFGDRQTRHHLDLRAASLSQRSESGVDVLGDAE